MTEQEYVDATDLAKLRTVKAILRDCMCMDDPNKTRLRGMVENCHLMIENLRKAVEVD